MKQREIKFRIWDKNDKCWLSDDDYEGINNHGVIVNDRDDMENLSLMEGAIIQQYTGLKDKNGKEIYEGDIVKDLDGDYGMVKFEHGSFIVLVKSQIIPFWSMVVNGNTISPRFISPETFIVVGNIFENAELLK